MKKLTFALALLVSCSAYASDCDAAAESKPNTPYLGGFGALNLLTTNTNDSDFYPSTGFDLGAAIGYRWRSQFRFEFEYTYRQSYVERRHSVWNSRIDITKKTHSYLANALWDLPLSHAWKVRPFVGGGVGYAHTLNRAYRTGWNRRGPLQPYKQDGFAWQIIAGAAYPIFQSVDLSLEYRLFKGPSRPLYSHSVGLGIKRYF